MFTAVLALHILVSILLILAVMIQGGENVDITAAFGGVSQAAFGPRGAVTTLQKATWVLGVIFMVTAVTLAVWATKTPGGSPLRTHTPPASQTAPASTPPKSAPPTTPATAPAKSAPTTPPK